MSASDRETRPVRVDDREGVQLDPLQQLERSRVPTHGGGGPPRSPRERDGGRRPEQDWKYNYRVLSAILGRQFVGGDMLRLLAIDIKRTLGEEAADEFMIHIASNRQSFMHDFMG